MGLREIRHRVAKLCRRLLVGAIEGVPELNQIREFDCRATELEREKSESGDRRLRAPDEVHGQGGDSLAPTQQSADSAGNKCRSASEVARGILGLHSTAAISNVLVLGSNGSTPLKRMEIRLRDPKEVPATLNLLVVALQRSGIDFRAVWNPAIPATEIWLTSPLYGNRTSPLHDGNRTLLSCAAMLGATAPQPAADSGSPRDQAQ